MMTNKTLRSKAAIAWICWSGAAGMAAAAAAEPTTGESGLRGRITTLLERQGLSPQAAATPAATAARRALAAKARRADAGTAAVPATAVGLMVQPADAQLRQLSRQGYAPPVSWQLQVERAAAENGLALSYQRVMSGERYVFALAAPADAAALEAVAERLRQQGIAAAVDVDLLVRRHRLSSDPYFSNQWNLSSSVQTYAGSVDAGRAWDTTIGVGTTVVAVVDTGVLPHPELAGRLLPGYDFISSAVAANDGNGRDNDATDPGDHVAANFCGSGEPAEDSSWHGTHVAGIIAAGGDNGQGMAGVNWRARILPVRVLGRCGGATSDILDGIRWAAGLTVPGVPANPTPAQVINLSLGGYSASGCTRAYRDAISEAKGQGALVVVAAGNKSQDYERYVPASCEGVLTVVAIDPYGDLASYSNYSFSGQMAAPGGDISRYGAWAGILSTVSSGTTTHTGWSYAYMAGTSMAAPHVSGIASLALAVNPRLGGEELTYLLELASRQFVATSTCRSLQVCGSGQADAEYTVLSAQVMADYQLVYEFYNDDLHHYFRTGAKSEAAGINRGAAGAGWYDTLDYFYGWTSAVDGAVPVCRFYGTPGRGPNSHFYTANAAECDYIKRVDPGWTYEGTAFYAKQTVNGVCPGDSVPVYRAYNGRWRQNDSNHRYTTDLTLYQQMITAGWAGEGIALCAAF